jgi:hypothetical protein
MQVKKITFPPYFEDMKNFKDFEDIIDIENDNIDVFVEVEEGYTYIVTLVTPKNIQYLMDEEKMNYFGPAYPYIFVKELTLEIIKETIEAYAKYNDGYWLKVSHFGGKIDETVFNKLQADQKNRFN